MTWHQQLEIITKIAQKKFLDLNRAFTFKDLEILLGLSRGITTHWKKGQRPSAKDMEKLCRGLGISPAWLLLGAGDPLEKAEPGEFNPEWVYIGDTLNDFLEGTLRVPHDEFAQAGGLAQSDLEMCLNSKKLPPATAIGRWVRRYRLNANFLLAQIGQPLLSESEYWREGPLTRVFEKLREDEGLPERKEGEDKISVGETGGLSPGEGGTHRRMPRETPLPSRETLDQAARRMGVHAPSPLSQDMETAARLLREAGADDEEIRDAIYTLIRSAKAPYPKAEAEQDKDRYGEAAEEPAPYSKKSTG